MALLAGPKELWRGRKKRMHERRQVAIKIISHIETDINSRDDKAWTGGKGQ